MRSRGVSSTRKQDCRRSSVRFRGDRIAGLHPDGMADEMAAFANSAVPVPTDMAWVETDRRTLMDKRGEGVPIIIENSERLSTRPALRSRCSRQGRCNGRRVWRGPGVGAGGCVFESRRSGYRRRTGIAGAARVTGTESLSPIIVSSAGRSHIKKSAIDRALAFPRAPRGNRSTARSKSLPG